MRCLVTGAAGFIGSHLAERLVALGHTVVGVDCFTPYYAPEIKRRNLSALRELNRFQMVEADLAEARLEPLVDGMELVFHLAGQPGVRDSWGVQFADYERHNVTATQRLLEALRGQSITRLVYASSSSVYGDAPLPMREDARAQPLSPYGVTKLAGENLVRAYWKCYGLPANMLRFFTVYGPRQRPDMAFNRFIAAIWRGDPISLYGDGRQTRDFTYVDDVVSACVQAAICERDGEILNVGGGASVSVNEVLGYLSEILGRPVHVEQHERQRGDASHTSASTARARDVLSWRPTVSVEEGLVRQADWQIGTEARRASRAILSSAHVSRRGPRLLLYGHDTYGLGHLRRNLTLAAGLTRELPDLSILLVTGSPAAHHFPLPENVDYIKLPSVVKVADEDYHARSLRLQPTEIVAMRAALLREAVGGFAPDVVLVDHAPAGMKGELLPALRELRQVAPYGRAVIGLRDIVDEPVRVRANWTEHGLYDVLETAYDAILVYGAQEMHDITTAYDFSPALTAKTRYCGYIERATSHGDIHHIRARYGCMEGDRLVVVTAGGGGDGYPLLQAYLAGARSEEAPQRTVSVLVTGPFMSAGERAQLGEMAGGLPHLRLVTFVEDMVDVMAAADLVVCMGGYNTLCEILSVGARALVVPRVEPRREQLLRAQAFEALGLVAMLHPDHLDPQTFSRRIGELLAETAAGGARPEDKAREAFIAAGSLSGLQTTIRIISDLLREATLSTKRAS